MKCRLPLALFLLWGISGCGRSSAGTALPDLAAVTDLQSAPGADLQTAGMTGDPQLPPTSGGAELTAWIQSGYYKSWHCEMSSHPAGPHGAHGTNRICSNNVLAAAGTTGDYPVGAASVKELYSGATVNGYAISVRVQAGAGARSVLQ